MDVFGLAVLHDRINQRVCVGVDAFFAAEPRLEVVMQRLVCLLADAIAVGCGKQCRAGLAQTVHHDGRGKTLGVAAVMLTKGRLLQIVNTFQSMGRTLLFERRFVAAHFAPPLDVGNATANQPWPTVSLPPAWR